jgi:hypothetical protein
MVALVERMLDLKQTKTSVNCVPSEVGRLEREIAASDAEIDDLVFKFYDITDKECTMIEPQK